MKNLIIIGNGFDKAHNMKTSYNEFIEDLFSKYFEDKNSYPNILNSTTLDNLAALKHAVKEEHRIREKDHGIGIKDTPFPYRSSKIVTSSRENSIFQFSNKFIEYLLYSVDRNNWCDIEYKYFEELMRYCNTTYDLSKMHEDFNVVKKYLSDYLINQEKKIKKVKGYVHFFRLVAGLSNSDKDTLILNFNYTKTIEKLYEKDVIKCSTIHIHGELKNEENPMIFGYAANQNEVDTLLSQNNNEFLKNIKKYSYKRTEKEKTLNNFLNSSNSEDIDVFILGHSCGLSDNWILSKIFNHESIRSINIFYHEKFDNYYEVQVNIDRISHTGFNKLVPCEKPYRMPQWNDYKHQINDFTKTLIYTPISVN